MPGPSGQTPGSTPGVGSLFFANTRRSGDVHTGSIRQYPLFLGKGAKIMADAQCLFTESTSRLVRNAKHMKM